MKSKKISDTSRAVAWMMADTNRTQVEAANKFGISQSGISNTKAREDFAIHYCETVPAMVEKIHTLLTQDPLRSVSSICQITGIDGADARLILLGLRAKATRNEALLGRVAHDPVAEMREKCAKIAEMVGGEHGALIAEVIRSVGV